MTKTMALVGTVSMAAALMTAPSAAAAPSTTRTPDPDLTITSVTLSRSAVTVSGLNRVAVGVTVKARYAAEGEHDPWPITVYLKRTGGVGAIGLMVATELPLTAGTVKDGTYTGTVEVPSTANGTFKVVSLWRGPLRMGGIIQATDTLFDGPSIAVTGVHVPKLVAQVIPRVVPFGSPYQVKAVIYDSATGKPYGSRIRLLVGADEDRCYWGLTSGSRLTDTAGVLYTSFPGTTPLNSMNCVKVQGNGFDTISLGFWPLRPGIVGVTPSKTSVPVNTVVPVNGTVLGAPHRCAVLLQRLHGRTVWRLASQDTVRQSGRFTVRAQPPNRGNNSYRVYFPTCMRFQAGYSRTFAIQGT